MEESNWEEERKQLLEHLAKAEQVADEAKQVAAECIGESAVYRDMVEEYYMAARQALDKQDVSYLHKVKGTAFFTTPSKEDVKRWGKDFLHAYKRDARWLRDAKKALEQIKVEVEKLSVDDNEANSQAKKNIIEIAKKGLITHL